MNGQRYYDGNIFEVDGTVFIQSEERIVEVHGVGADSAELAIKEDSAVIDRETFEEDEIVRFYDSNTSIMKNDVRIGSIVEISDYSVKVIVTDY